MSNYIVATLKTWNIEAFYKHTEELSGKWHLITDESQLTLENLAIIEPSYIFFPHWSSKVPSEIINRFNCVCFHMTDLPYGRGGSPLQNLIIRGHKKTKLTALKMVDEFDAGPIYMKKPLSLEESAEAIYKRMAALIYEMISEIVREKVELKEQVGEVSYFKRRTPCESVLPKVGEISSLYDFIRMLDAPSYPKAYLEYGDFKISFSNAFNNLDKIEASIVIEKREKNETGN